MQQWGQHVERLEALASTGKKIKALEDRPKLDDFLRPFYFAFHDLRAESNPNSGYITWGAVSRYCDDIGFSDKELMFDILRLAQNKVFKWTELNSTSSQPPRRIV